MTAACRKIRVGRYLSMAEVADLMKLPASSANRRAERVRRLIVRMGERDGTSYLKRIGRRYYVSTAALEQLLPWDPGTLHQIRADVEDLQRGQSEQNKRLNDHASQLRNQRKINACFIQAGKLNAMTQTPQSAD